MPTHNFTLHGELAPYLDRFPGLFAFYPGRVKVQSSWVKDTGMVDLPYRYPPPFLTRLYTTLDNPPSPPLTHLSNGSIGENGYYNSTTMSSSHSMKSLSPSMLDSDRYWFYTGRASPRPEILHSSSYCKRKGKKNSYFQQGWDLRSDAQNSTPSYDFRRVDNLLLNLTSLLQSCSIHIASSEGTATNPPTNLPERLSSPLTALHSYLDIEVSTLIPRSSAPENSWHRNPVTTPSVNYSVKSNAPIFERELPLSLGSHPPKKSLSSVGDRNRLTQILRSPLGTRSYLLPSFLALLTAKAVVLYLQNAIFSVQSRHVPTYGTYYSSSDSIRSYGVPSKAGEVLGLYCFIPILNSDTMIHGSRAGLGTGVSDGYSYPTLENSIHEIKTSLENPQSSWTPWCPLSSLSSKSTSKSTPHTPKVSKSFNNRSSQAVSLNNDNPFETRVTKLKELEKHTEKLLRFFGGATAHGLGNSGDNGRSTIDNEIENCRKLLVREGFLK